MDTVDEIRRRLDVSEVLSSYLQLKPAGRNQKALCPFHHEKTPSLMVSDEKGIWHCFGCGEGGDIFSFVMKMEGLDFRGALELLAKRAGVTLEESQGQSSQKLRQRLFYINELAARYYQAVLSKSPSAQNYLKKRGFTQASLKTWRLGYAPTIGTALVKFLKSRGISQPEMARAGLVRLSGRQDLFKGRLLIPLADPQGKVVGFTGRVLDGGLPKYLNSPQTLLFDKGRLVFGLHLAKEAIRQQDEAVVVEGHLDVIASHQAGVKQVVATGGTALTVGHLKPLARLSKNIKLAFDQDKAGVSASERAIPLAQSVGASLAIVELGGAKDPDELLRQTGGEAKWKQAIASAPQVMDWLLKVLSSQYDLSTALGKKHLTDRITTSLARFEDPVEQDHYIRKLAQTLKVAPAVIRQKLSQRSSDRSTAKRAEAVYQAPAQREAGSTVEEALLSLVVSFPDTRTALGDLSADHFSQPKRSELVAFLKNQPSYRFDTPESLPPPLAKEQNYIKIMLFRGEEGYQDWAPLDRRIEAFSLAARLQNIYIKKQRTKINQELKAAEAAGDSARKLELLKQFRDLSRKV